MQFLYSVRINYPHEGKDFEILEQRKEVYENAKQANPWRWTGPTRHWNRIESVWLNPEKQENNLGLTRQLS
ncbi:MAG: hypothetical protein JKY67_18390 [Pseudomonadales bacterium]|nr:hypothetical protein [Pseudomonadales bacterium]